MFEDNSGNDGSSSSSSDDDSQDSSTEAAKPSEENEMMHQGGSTPEMDEIGSASPEKTDRLKPDQTKSSWNDLFGFPTTVLAKALCPSASGHKKRFEVGFNGKVFLGRPVFARPDSTWRKPKRPRRSSSRSNITAEKVKKDQGREDALGRNTLNQKKRDNKVSEQDFGAENHSDTQQDGNSMMKAGGSEEVESAEDETDPRVVKRPSAISIPIFKMEKQLAMFNVVFVLQPPPLEYHLRVKEMYDNVTKKLSKALKWEQARSNYVATEAALISSSTKQLDRSSKDSLFDLIAVAHLRRGNATFSYAIPRFDIPV